MNDLRCNASWIRMVHAGFGKVRGARPVTCRALGQSTGLVEPVFSFRWHAPFYRRWRGIIPHVASARVHTSWPGTARVAAVSGSAAAAADALRAWFREAATRVQTTWSVAGEQRMFSLRIKQHAPVLHPGLSQLSLPPLNTSTRALETAVVARNSPPLARKHPPLQGSYPSPPPPRRAGTPPACAPSSTASSR